MAWLLLALLPLVQGDEDTARKVRMLRVQLEEAKDDQAWTVALELGDLGPAARDALPALRKRLESKSALDRGCAAAALLLIDQAEAPRAFPVLRALFKLRGETLVQLTLMSRLGKTLRPTTQETVLELLRLAGDAPSLGWVLADMALARVEAANREARAGLEAGLKEPGLEASVLAARTLARLDPGRVKDLVPFLRKGLALEDVAIRLGVAEELLKLAPTEQKAVLEAVALGLKDSTATGRAAVAAFLLEVEPAQAEKVLPVLLALVKAEDGAHAETGLRAVTAVVRRKQERLELLVPFYTAALETEGAVRLKALGQLGELGPLALPLERKIREQSRSPDAGTAATAHEALMRVRPERASDRLAQFLELVEKRDRTANGIREFIARFELLRKTQETLEKEPWVEGLAALIDRHTRESSAGWNRDELLRLHAISELASLGAMATKGAPALVRLLREGNQVKAILRSQAALALGKIGKVPPDAVALLNRAVREEQEAPDVRAAARDALRLISRAGDR